MKVEVRNNARNEKRVLEYYNDVEAFQAIHEKILSDDQASAEFEANDWGDPYELTLDKFVDEFGASISVGDYTYSFVED